MAIGVTDASTRQFYQEVSGDRKGYSSFDRSMLHGHVVARPVAARSLQSLAEQNKHRSLHVLKLDIGGHETTLLPVVMETPWLLPPVPKDD